MWPLLGTHLPAGGGARTSARNVPAGWCVTSNRVVLHGEAVPT